MYWEDVRGTEERMLYTLRKLGLYKSETEIVNIPYSVTTKVWPVNIMGSNYDDGDDDDI